MEIFGLCLIARCEKAIKNRHVKAAVHERRAFEVLHSLVGTMTMDQLSIGT